MSTPAVGTREEILQNSTNNYSRQPRTFWQAVTTGAVLGGTTAFLLAVVECFDLQFQLTPVFSSLGERATLAVYYALDVFTGSLVIALISAGAFVLARLKVSLETFLAGGKRATLWNKAISLFLFVIVGAALINQQHDANKYAVSLLREAEKLPHAVRFILPFEKPISYLVIAAFLLSAWILLTLARTAARWSLLYRSALWIVILLVCAISYYLDSRMEVQQYEFSLHRTLFLICSALSLCFVTSVYLSTSRVGVVRQRSRKLILLGSAVAVTLATIFTFAEFDRNQNLKTQIFYRTTQAKQYFKFVQWALDFDRDGYSSLLGGGDSDDHNSSVNPGRPELLADGIDNNAFGGDLTQESITSWQGQFNSLHAVVNPSPHRYNIIYFFIDTLRADHLGAYGYKRGTSPNIDKLADKSCVFENAFSPSPYTYEAAPKFMESSYWDGHFETWTETLEKSGYHTVLFPRRLSMLLRYVKGMQQVVDASRKGLRQTVDAAIEELGKLPTDKPFCAYIYSSDPHRPYRPHPGINFGPHLIDQYDGEVAYTDYHLGRLFDWMEKSGRMNDTMIVIMADHGESFGERMVYKHNSQVYDEQMRVPAIFYVPGQSPRRVTDYISTVDLAPTILNIAGVDCPAHYAGVSLLSLMLGRPFEHPPIYGEHDLVENSLASPDKWIDPEIKKFIVVTQDGYKLIYNQNYYCFELYNLKSDPKELHNLFDKMPAKSDEMKRLLGRFVDVVSVMRPPDADEQKHAGSVDDDESVK